MAVGNTRLAQLRRLLLRRPYSRVLTSTVYTNLLFVTQSVSPPFKNVMKMTAQFVCCFGTRSSLTAVICSMQHRYTGLCPYTSEEVRCHGNAPSRVDDDVLGDHVTYGHLSAVWQAEHMFNRMAGLWPRRSVVSAPSCTTWRVV